MKSVKLTYLHRNMPSDIGLAESINSSLDLIPNGRFYETAAGIIICMEPPADNKLPYIIAECAEVAIHGMINNSPLAPMAEVGIVRAQVLLDTLIFTIEDYEDYEFVVVKRFVNRILKLNKF